MLTRCLAWGLILLAPLASLMAADKPIASIALSGYGEILGDAEYVAKLLGRPGVSTQIETMLTFVTQGALAQTLDRARPWGAVVSTDGVGFSGLVFLPVNDAKKLLAPLAAAGVTPEEAGDGVLKIQTPQLPMPVFIKQQGAWTFVAQSLNDITTAPADPVAALGGLEKKYDVSVRLHPQNVPQAFRDMMLDQIKAGMDAAGAGQAAQNDELQKRMQANSFNQIKQLFTECADMTVGVAVDQKAKNAVVETTVSAVPGTHLAQQCSGLKDAKSNFGGFVLPDAAINFSSAQNIDKQDVAQLTDTLTALQQQLGKHLDQSPQDAAAKKAIKEVAADLFKSLTATVNSGKMDAAGSVLLDGKNPGVLAAAQIADTKSLESAVKRLLEMAQKDGELKDVKLDAETVGSVRFHKIGLPVPPEAAPVLGTKYDVAIGIGPSAVYLATGPDGLNQFKKANAAGSKANGSANQLTVSVGKVVAFANNVKPDPQAAAYAAALAKQPGKDRITLRVLPQSNGVVYRLEAEAALLEAAGQAFGPQRTR